MPYCTGDNCIVSYSFVNVIDTLSTCYICLIDEGGLEGPTQGSKRLPLPSIEKSVVPPVNRPENSSSPPESRREIQSERRPPTVDRPDSQLSRVRSPLGMTKGEVRTGWTQLPRYIMCLLKTM